MHKAGIPQEVYLGLDRQWAKSHTRICTERYVRAAEPAAATGELGERMRKLHTTLQAWRLAALVKTVEDAAWAIETLEADVAMLRPRSHVADLACEMTRRTVESDQGAAGAIWPGRASSSSDG